MKNGGKIRRRSCSRASLILPYLFRTILPGQFFDIRLSMKSISQTYLKEIE
jgi:hypothetical protein